MRRIYLLEPLDIPLRFELPDPGVRLLPLPDRPLRRLPLDVLPDSGDESPSPLLRDAEDKVPVGPMEPLASASLPAPCPDVRDFGERADGLLMSLLREDELLPGLFSPLFGDAAPADGDDSPLRADGPPLLPDGLLFGDTPAAPAEGEDSPLRADGPPLLPLCPYFGEAAPAEGEDSPLRADGPRLLT